MLLCTERGDFVFYELKATKARAGKVDLSPHQVAWLTRHSHARCFIVVRDGSLALRVFPASAAVDLRMDDFAAVEALAVFSEPYDWESFFRLTSPVE